MPLSHLSHQDHQREVIAQIEAQVQQNALTFSTVVPQGEDFEADSRMSLTSVHLPRPELIEHIQTQIIAPLRAVDPRHYYYADDSLHLTIKNVKVIADPVPYTSTEVETAKNVFAAVVPRHHAFHVYYYRLLLFPHNLALIGTTDPELDALALDLDHELRQAGVPDDKKYLNDHYFFSNVTLARFTEQPSAEFVKKMREISASLQFESYLVDTVTLLTSNAVLKKRTIVGEWTLNR